jgi:hypothetical protein
VITIEAFDIYAGTMNKRVNIRSATQSAQLKMNEITKKSAKIKQANKIANATAIFFWFFCVWVRLLLVGNLLLGAFFS